MKQDSISERSDSELLEEYKKAKSNKIIAAVLIGTLAGVSVFSFIKKGVNVAGVVLLFVAIFFVYEKKSNPGIGN